jgi:putative transposase
MIKRAYKTELDPTLEQRRALAQHVSGARVAHNWVLEQWRTLDWTRAIANGMRALVGNDARGGEAACWFGYGLAALHSGGLVKARTLKGETQRYRYRPVPGVQIPDFRPSVIDWYSQLVYVREEQPERFGWLSDISAFAVREAVLDVSAGWKHFFENLKAGRYEKAGEPKFRNRRHTSYHADQPDPIRVTDRAVKIPGIGWVRLKERRYLPATEEKSHRFPYGGKAFGIGISERDGRWYVALRCEVPEQAPQARGAGRALRERPTPRVSGRRMGVENGVRVLAVGYDGDSSNVISEEGLRDDSRIKKLEMIRHRWERRMSRRWKNGTSRQSRGWQEARARVAHYHARIVALRDDRVGKFVRKIVDRGAEIILLREPHVAALLDRRTAPDPAVRNRLAKDLQGARMGDLGERLKYKQKWAGGDVELVDKFDPVTRRCSVCGVVRETSPGYPTFVCRSCGHTEDRDCANAPRNLHDYSGSNPGDGMPAERGREADKSAKGRSNRKGSAPDRLGNQVRPGAPVSDGAIDTDSHLASERERRSGAKIGSEQYRLDTASPKPSIGDRSQTDSQVLDLSIDLRASSGSR